MLGSGGFWSITRGGWKTNERTGEGHERFVSVKKQALIILYILTAALERSSDAVVSINIYLFILEQPMTLS